MVLWLSPFPQAVDPRLAQERVARLVAGLPYSQRLTALSAWQNRRLDGPMRDDGTEALFVAEQIRSLAARPIEADLVRRVDPLRETDPRLLRAAFVASGDAWARAVQTKVFRRLGGEHAPESVRIWYAMFPILYASDPQDLKTLDAIGRSFPKSFVPPLMKAQTVMEMLRRRWSGLTTYEVPASLFDQALSDTDRAYALASRRYGRDLDWSRDWKVRLERMRKAALTKPLRKKGSSGAAAKART